MATETKGLKFFHVASLPETGVIGGIYFDTTKGEISVYGKSGWERYSGNVKSVVWSGTPANDSGKLVITNFDGSKSEIDFSDVASKTQVAEDIKTAKADVLQDAKDYVNARKVNGKTLDADIVLDGRDIKLDGYKKADAKAAIATTDTVNVALGKLEAAIDETGGNALTHVTAGAGISVTDKLNHDQTISVKIDAASEKFGESAVLTASADGLKISGIKNAIDTAIGGLDVNDAAVANKYVSSVSETDGKISVTRADLPVIGVADNDKILSLSGAKIGADLSLTYDSTAKKIYLYGKAKGGSETGKYELGSVNCTDFIKDGMLKDASYNDSTHILTLTFNSDAGDKTIDVNLSGLVDTYDAGDGLTLDKTGAHPTFKINLTEGGTYLGIVDGKLRLDETKIHSKISGDITTAINGLTSDAANTAAGAGDAASSQIKVTVSEAAGKLTGVTVNAPIFALPSDIETAKTNLIGSSTTDTKGSNTIWGAKKYADDAAAGALKDAKAYTDAEIQKLDAEFTQAASATEGLALHVKQEDGKITAFSGSMNWCEW